MTVKKFKINYSNIGGSNDQWKRGATLKQNDRLSNLNRQNRLSQNELDRDLSSSQINNRPQGPKQGRTLADLASSFSPSSRNNRPQGPKQGRTLADLASSFSPSRRNSRAHDLDKQGYNRNFTRNALQRQDIDDKKVSSNECSDSSNFYPNNIDKFFDEKLKELNFDESWTVENTMSIYDSPEPNETLTNFVDKFMLECFPNLIKWYNNQNRGTFFPISIYQYLDKEYFLDMLSGNTSYHVGIFKTINTDSRIGKAIKLYNCHMGSLHGLLYEKRKPTPTPTPTPTSDLNQDLVNSHLEELSKLHFQNVNIITSQNIDFKYNKNSNNYSYNLEGNSDSEIINNNNEYISYIEELNPRAFSEVEYKNFYFIDYSNLILGIKKFEKLGLSGDPWWGNFHARMMTKVIRFFIDKKIDEINSNEGIYNELQFNFYLFTKKDSGYHDPYNRQYNDNTLPIPIKFTIEDNRLKELIRKGIKINTELSLCTNRKINNEDVSRLIDSQKNLDFFQTTNKYYDAIKKIGNVSERKLTSGGDKSALHSITSFDDACLLKKYAIMKKYFQEENTNFYLISGDNYRDRASGNRNNFTETQNFFNYNGNVQNNLLELGNRMNTYINSQQDEIKNLAKNVSVAPFIERSIRYEVRKKDNANNEIIFTSEITVDKSTDYKFYIHSFPIFDRNFDVTFESSRI